MKQFGQVQFARWMMVVVAVAFAASVSRSEAQVVPVPIAVTPIVGTVGGGCSTSIPLFIKSGTAPNYGDGCPGANAILSSPNSSVVDSYGNVFFADQSHYDIRVLYEGGAALAQAIVNANPQTTTLTAANIKPGYVYNLAGGIAAAPVAPYYCNENGTGQLSSPLGVRLLGCPGSEAYVAPRSVALDTDGNVFYTSTNGATNISVFYVGGTKAKNLILTENAIYTPVLTTLTPGNVYVVGGALTADGHTADGLLGTQSEFESPMRGLYVDANENVYIPDEANNVVRVINGTSGTVSTVAGACVPLSGSTQCESAAQAGLPPGYGDGGPATSAMFNYPYSIAVDGNGNVFIADSGSNGTTTTPIPGRVRVVYEGTGTLAGIPNPQKGYIYTYAGGGTSIADNIPATSVLFDQVWGVSIDAAGYLYVDDHRVTTTNSQRIWRVDPVTGIATVVIGNGGSKYGTATGVCSTTPGPTHTDVYGSGCPATQSPLGGASQNYLFDKAGNGYLTDQGYNLIRKYSYDNIFPATAIGSSSAAQYVAFDIPANTTVNSLTVTAGGVASTEFSDGGATTDTCTGFPKTFTVDTTCAFFIKFTPAAVGFRTGIIQINGASGVLGSQFLSGTGVAGGLTIDPGTAGSLGSGITPEGVAVDEQGNAYLSDGKGNQVLRIPQAGGTATAIITGLNGPRQVAVDGQGTVYAVDSGNNRVARYTASGTTTYLGTGLKSPQGVAVDFDGNVYIADTGNGRVVELGAPTYAQSNLTIPNLVSPSSLTFDAAGNLYVVDSGSSHIIEIPAIGPQQILTLPSTIASPAAVSVDLAGDLFVADSTNTQIIEVPVGSTTLSSVVLGALTTPVGLAIDSQGDLYVADSGNSTTTVSSIITVNRLVASLVFPQTDIKLSTFPTASMTLTSAGNSSINLATPLFTNTNTPVFPVTPPTTGACTPGGAFPVGSSCSEVATFHPTAAGAQSAVVTYPSTANSVVANLSGLAVNLIFTSVTVTQTQPVSGNVYVGQSVSVTAAVVPTSGTGTPTGTFTFTVDTGKPVTQPLSTPTLTVTLPLGVHTVKACYSGDSAFGASCGTTTVTVVLNPTSTSLTTSAGLSGAGGQITLTAGVSSTTNSTVPTGAVTFYNASTVIGTAQLAGGVATLTIGPFSNYPYATPSFMACYVGNTIFAGSCVTITGGTDFIPLPMGLTAGTTSLGVSPDSPAVATIIVLPINGYTGTLTGSCSNLPANTVCRFPVPATVVLGSNNTCPGLGPVVEGGINPCVSFQIYAGINPNTASLRSGMRPITFAMLWLWPAGIVLLFGVRKCRIAAGYPVLLGILLLTAAIGLGGCGNGSSYSPSYVTTPGAYNVTVTLTDTNNISRSVVLPITVTAP